MQFRNRLVVIDAVQFHVYDLPWPDGVEQASQSTHPTDSTDPNYWPTGTPIVHTGMGTFCVKDGEWIITRSNGEKYICADKTFRALWEPYDPPRIVTVQ